jgi:hypothetical protein
MRRLVTLTTVLLFALVVVAAAKAVTVKFKTGPYSAKTSQGARFKRRRNAIPLNRPAPGPAGQAAVP